MGCLAATTVSLEVKKLMFPHLKSVFGFFSFLSSSSLSFLSLVYTLCHSLVHQFSFCGESLYFFHCQECRHADVIEKHSVKHRQWGPVEVQVPVNELVNEFCGVIVIKERAEVNCKTCNQADYQTSWSTVFFSPLGNLIVIKYNCFRFNKYWKQVWVALELAWQVLQPQFIFQTRNISRDSWDQLFASRGFAGCQVSGNSITTITFLKSEIKCSVLLVYLFVVFLKSHRHPKSVLIHRSQENRSGYQTCAYICGFFFFHT